MKCDVYRAGVEVAQVFKGQRRVQQQPYTENPRQPKMKLIITVAVVLAIAVVTQAKGGKSRRGGKNRGGASSEESGGFSGLSKRHQDGARYSWTRLIGSESPAREDAFVPTNDSTILVRSEDRALRALNYSKALTLYDYANDSNVVVILVENTCYLTDTALTYQQVVDTLNSRNGTNVTDATKSYLNGTQPALSKAEAQAIYLKYPQVQRLCHEGRLVQALDAEEGDQDSTTLLVRGFTLEEEFNLIVNAPAPPPTRPPQGLRGLLGGKGGHSGERGGHSGERRGRH